MALVNITPVMTSNTTPAPYVVSASGYYGVGNEPWRAFDSVSNTIDCWATQNGTPTGWIKIDLNTAKKINAFTIYTRNTSVFADMAKDFVLYGSNDDIVYEQIKTISGQVGWVTSEGRLYRLDSPVTFRYYKLVITANNGAAYSIIGDIRLWQDDSIVPTVTNKEASGAYGLAHNSTLNMLQRVNDSREGLLGFADDVENYGTLWMVNNKGQAEIPKARLANADVLFSGFANTKGGTYTLAGDATKYKYLLAIAGQSTMGLTFDRLIDVSMMTIGNYDQFIISQFATTGAYTHIRFGFVNSTSIKINELLSANWAMGIVKILGIK